MWKHRRSLLHIVQGEEALMHEISWRSGRVESVCRSATCAETRAMVNLEDELFALRYHWSEMLGNTALENSPDEMARLVRHTVTTPEGVERRVDIE